MPMLEELLVPDLREAIRDGDWVSLSEFCSILHPSLVAQTLCEAGDVELVWSAFSQVPPSAKAVVFEYFPEEVQDALVSRLDIPDLAKLLEKMAHDDRVDLVKRMDEEKQTIVMRVVAHADREDILRLKNYAEGTAGSIMTTDYAALHGDLTVEQALHRLRREAPDRETIYYIYVIDDDRRLTGFVSLKDLIIAPPKRTVRQTMREDVLFATVGADVEEAARTLARYDLLALPVVDEEKRLVGIITHDDVIDVVVEEATEDAHRMGAMQPLRDSYLQSPFWQMFRKRVVWLGALFFAEMFTYIVLRSYEGLLHEFAFMVVFMPVITATGGNSGSQAASMITRALALGEITDKDAFRIGFREFFSGASLGLSIGFLGVVVVLLFHRDRPTFALVLLTALVCVTICGSLIGSLMPLVFKRLGMDPAISSGPFVASVVDVAGIFIYCTIALVTLHTLGL